VNDLMKQAVSSTGLDWTAWAPMLLFMAVFVGFSIWALRNGDSPPELE
jgi:hypothetical protein